MGNRHIRNTEVDVVEKVNKRNFDLQLGAFGKSEALRHAEIPVDGAGTFDNANPGCAKPANGSR